MFSPKNHREELVFATEELKADVQYEMLRAMKINGLSRKDMAKKMRVSQARVSQMLSDEANLTLENIARFFHEAGADVGFSINVARESSAGGVSGFADGARQQGWRPSGFQSNNADSVENSASKDSRRWSFAYIGAERPQRLIAAAGGSDLSNDNKRVARGQFNAA